MVFKCLNNVSPSYLNEFVTVKGRLSKSFCQRILRGISHAAPKVWNELPCDVM